MRVQKRGNDYQSSEGRSIKVQLLQSLKLGQFLNATFVSSPKNAIEKMLDCIFLFN
jgi:hypothetical protein